MKNRSTKGSAIAILSALLLSGQASASSIFSFAEINIPFEIKVSGTWSEVFHSQESWESFFIHHAELQFGPDSELNVPPGFDFDMYSVIAGGLGSGGSGRALMIEYVRDTSLTTHIGAVIVNAGNGCNSSAVITYPSVVILIPKPKEDLQFYVREAVSDCE